MENLLLLLNETFSSNNTSRRSAEIQLSEALSSAACIMQLTNITTSNGYPLHICQLAIILLGQKIGKSRFAISSEAYAEIVEFLFGNFRSKDSCIQNAAMVAIAKIYSHASLLEQELIKSMLLNTIQQKDITIFNLCCRGLLVIAEELADWTQIINFLITFYSNLENIFTTLDISHTNTLRTISKLLRVSIEKLSHSHIYDNTSKNTQNLSYIHQIVAKWTTISISWINHSIFSPSFSQNQIELNINLTIPILYELTQNLTKSLEFFYEKCVADNYPVIMDISWKLLCQLRSPHMLINSNIDLNNKYENTGLSNLEDYNSSNDNSGDGDRTDVSTLVSQILELLSIGLSCPHSNVHDILQQDLQPLLQLLTDFIQLTPQLQTQWTQDPNEFVSCEQDDVFEYNLRLSGAEVLIELCRSESTRVIGTVMALVESSTAQFLQSTSSIGSHIEIIIGEALRLEAMLWMLGSVGKYYMKKYRTYGRSKDQRNKDKVLGKSTTSTTSSKNTLIADIPAESTIQFLKSTVLMILGSSLNQTLTIHPVVLGRSIWLCAIYTLLFDVETRCWLAVVCRYLLQPHWPLAVRLQACRALGDIIYISNTALSSLTSTTATMQPILVELIHLTAALSEVTSNTTAHFPIETVISLLKYSVDETLQTNDCFVIVSLAMSVWTRFPGDQLCVEVTKEMLCSLVSHPIGSVTFLSYFFDWSRAICGHNNNNNNSTTTATTTTTSSNSNDCKLGEALIRSRASKGVITSLLVVLKSIAMVIPTATGTESGIRSYGNLPTLITYNKHDVLLAVTSILREEVRECQKTSLSSTSKEIAPGNTLPDSHGEETPWELLTQCLDVSASVLTAMSTQDIRGGPQINLCASSSSSSSSLLSCVEVMKESISFALLHGGPEVLLAATGLLVHLLGGYLVIVGSEVAKQLLELCVSLTREHRSDFGRRCIMMTLVHLVARDAIGYAGLLGQISLAVGSSNDGGVTRIPALGWLLDCWNTLQTELSKEPRVYNLAISTIGLIRIAGVIAQYEGRNQIMAGQILHFALSSLPHLLQKAEDDIQYESDISDGGDCSWIDDDDDDDWEDDEDDVEVGDEEDISDALSVDSMPGRIAGNATNNSNECNNNNNRFQSTFVVHGTKIEGNGKRSKKDPFAASETVFLSDLLDSSGNNNSNSNSSSRNGGNSSGGGGNGGIYSGMGSGRSLPDDMVFRPASSDPLLSAGVQAAITSALEDLLPAMSQPGLRVSLPEWMSRELPNEDLRLIHALLG